MRIKKIISIAIILKLLSITSISIAIPSAGDLEIEIKGIKSMSGCIMLAVYDKEECFMNIDKAIRKEILPIEAGTIKCRIENLPHGLYAVTVFHDMNKNQILDKNFIGKPKEPYGFSNNIRKIFRAPKFKECVFNFDSLQQKIAVNLK